MGRAKRISVRYVGDGAEPDPRLDALEEAEGIDVGAGSLEEADCVVCGHRPPDLDGVAMVESIGRERPSLPVVIAPADGGEEVAAEAVAAGAAGYVPSDAPGEVPESVRSAATPPLRADGALRYENIEAELSLKERAMDEAPVGITIGDASREDIPLIYVNDAFERITGYGKDEVLGRNCRFLQGPDTREEPVARMREAVEEGKPVSVEVLNYRKDGEEFWNEVNIAPLVEDGEITHFLGFQQDVTDRKEAELALREERRNLEHLLDRIEGLLADVTRALVEGTSRDAIEAAVCERLADTDTDTYDPVWIGAPDLNNETLRVRAWEGTGSDPGDIRIDLSEGGPIARAVETGERRILTGGELSSVRGAPWLGGHDTEGVVVVPLAYGEAFYGTLVVSVDDEEALNERELTVLSALGRAAATAINALETRRILGADNVVELSLDVDDRGLFFVDLSARAGCRMEYRGSARGPEAEPALFFSVEADADTVREVAGETPGIEAARLVTEGEDTCLFEFRPAETSIVSLLAERGAKTRSIEVEDGLGRLVVEISSESDARALLETLRDRYPGTDLAAYHERERPPTTKEEFIAGVRDRLTDRQLAALQRAYVSGFYEWNRPISGDELAEAMDISRSTFHQHLRAAERKLVGEFFDGEA